jgi:hypothetical protein
MTGGGAPAPSGPARPHVVELLAQVEPALLRRRVTAAGATVSGPKGSPQGAAPQPYPREQAAAGRVADRAMATVVEHPRELRHHKRHAAWPLAFAQVAT